MKKPEYHPTLAEIAQTNIIERRNNKIKIGGLLSLVICGFIVKGLIPNKIGENIVDEKELNPDAVALIQTLKTKEGAEQLLSDINPKNNPKKTIRDLNKLATTLKETAKDCEAPVEINTVDKSINSSPLGKISRVEDLNNFTARIQSIRLACLTIVPFTKPKNGHAPISVAKWITAEPTQELNIVGKFSSIGESYKHPDTKKIYINISNNSKKDYIAKVFFHEKHHELDRPTLPYGTGDLTIAKSILGSEIFEEWKQSGFNNTLSPQLSQKLKDIGLNNYALFRYDTKKGNLQVQQQLDLMTESAITPPTEIDTTAAEIIYKIQPTELEKQTVQRFLDLMQKYNPDVEIYSKDVREKWLELVRNAISLYENDKIDEAIKLIKSSSLYKSSLKNKQI
jgi:hypothetical protein